MNASQSPDVDIVASALEGIGVAFADLNRTLPFTAARSTDALSSLGSANQQLKPLLRWAVYAAADNGMPEAEIARRSSLDRMTVRAWLGKQLKRGDRVSGLGYHGEDTVTGTYVPRDDCRDAQPPLDAAWIDDGSVDGPWMVKRETVRRTGATELS